MGVYLSLPLMLWCDNVFALALASNLVFHVRTKHIKVDYNFIREKVLNRDLQINFISTHDQLADIFTKALSSPLFLNLGPLKLRISSLNFLSSLLFSLFLHTFPFLYCFSSSTCASWSSITSSSSRTFGLSKFEVVSPAHFSIFLSWTPSQVHHRKYNDNVNLESFDLEDIFALNYM